MPTENELQTQIGLAVTLYNNALLYGVPTFLPDVDAIIQAADGDYAVNHLNAIEATRAQFAGVYASPTVSTAFGPLFLEYAKIVNSPHTDIANIFNDVRRWMISTAQTIQERNIAYGPPVADGGNIGDGVIHRLTVTKDGYNIENVHIESKKSKCVQDAFSGAQEQEEVFDLQGSDANKDQINIEGSGLSGSLTAVSARNSQQFITNPGFEASQYTDLATITSLGGWETASGDFTNLELAGDKYRSYPGIGDTPLALKFTGNQEIFQSLANRTINSSLPMFVQIAFKRENSCDGDLTLKLGSHSILVPLIAQTGWVAVSMPLGKSSWYDDFNETDLKLQIFLENNTTGEVLVDDVTMAQMVPFDRTYYLAVGGPTPFLRDDYFAWMDALVGADAKIQQWLWRAFGEHLPASAAPTWPDP